MAKYSKGAGSKVKEAMHEKKEGKLKTGSGKKVTSRKQAIAIGLSEAREEGEKVPTKKGTAKKAAAKKGTAKKAASKKASAKKSTSQKSTTKTAAGKKGGAKKATSKKQGAKKSTSRK